jgi:hypothetical protein
MLKIFKPITDITKSFGGILEGARGFLETAGAGGLKGVVREAFDFNAEGLKSEADRRMGRIIMHLTMAGDTESVEIALRFRNYAAVTIDDLNRLNEISAGADTDDLEKIRLMINRMAEYLDSHEGETPCSDQEVSLQQEIAKLKQINRRLSLFVESEEAFLAGEGRPPSRYPTIGTPQETPRAGYPVAGTTGGKPQGKYPLAGDSRKKPPPAGGEQADKA